MSITPGSCYGIRTLFEYADNAVVKILHSIEVVVFYFVVESCVDVSFSYFLF